jgi:adenine deaminase
MAFVIIGNLVDILQEKIFPAELVIEGEKILSVTPMPQLQPEVYILPGFIDAHIHIESSMLIPSEFARLAVVHGPT